MPQPQQNTQKHPAGKHHNNADPWRYPLHEVCCIKYALAFNTLLSSQETDTHHSVAISSALPGCFSLVFLLYHSGPCRPNQLPGRLPGSPPARQGLREICADTDPRWSRFVRWHTEVGCILCRPPQRLGPWMLPGLRPACGVPFPSGHVELYGWTPPSSNRCHTRVCAPLARRSRGPRRHSGHKFTQVTTGLGSLAAGQLTAAGPRRWLRRCAYRVAKLCNDPATGLVPEGQRHPSLCAGCSCMHHLR
jgi:hypothetical protein